MAQRTGHSQDRCHLVIDTPLGKDVLLLDAFEGEEALSRLFSFSLEMRSSVGSLQLDALVGSAVGVTLTEAALGERHFHGIVSRFSYHGSAGDFSRYSAEMVPRLWLLTLGRDRVVYQNQTTVAIVTALLDENTIAYRNALTGKYTAREYCVRYDETAFDFICRLMEEEGIFWFFTFADGEHTLVLADAPSVHVACARTTMLRMVSGGTSGALSKLDELSRFDVAGQMVVQGQALSDYVFETPGTKLLASSQGRRGRGVDFAYPGRHASVPDGAARAQRRVEAFQAQAIRGTGEGVSPFLSAGAKFTLTGHERSELNAEHVLCGVRHRARDGAYANSFETLPFDIPFRPPCSTPRPVVAGCHTAMVTGSSGEDIWTDRYGRVKLHFPWDRMGAEDQDSSCWVRVAQSWAGQGWGAFMLPRVGQEVIVSYVDGDPDRPLVIGGVHNADQTVPVALPAMQTQTVLRSRSSKDGTGGNELRFEDKADREELYLHAQRDMNVQIRNDLTTTLIEGAERHTVKKGDRLVAVEAGKETHTVKGSRRVEVADLETHVNQADFTQEVAGRFTLKVAGDLVIDVSGAITFKSARTIAIEAGASLETRAGTRIVNEAGTSMDNRAGTALTNKAGTDLTNESTLGLSNRAGTTLASEAPMVNTKASASQTLTGGGLLTLKGGLVKIN